MGDVRLVLIPAGAAEGVMAKLVSEDNPLPVTVVGGGATGGTATGGSTSTLVDSTQSLVPNSYIGATLYITHGGVTYPEVVLSNTATTFVFAASANTYGRGDTYGVVMPVTSVAVTSLPGTPAQTADITTTLMGGKSIANLDTDIVTQLGTTGVKIASMPNVTLSGSIVPQAGAAGITSDGKLYVSESGDLVNLPTGYIKLFDRDKYQIFGLKAAGDQNRVGAIYQNIAVKLQYPNGSVIQISEAGINGPYTYSVILNSTNFPGLIAGSYVKKMLVLPWTRNLSMSGPQNTPNWRLVVITNTGQIYHNFPSRAVGSDGAYVAGDEILFEESAVWDLPERKFPSTSPAASGEYFYFPCLPAANYVQHPILNTDGGFANPYGNGGFGISATNNGATCPRFYRPSFATANNSFDFMQGFEPGEKLTLIGTYELNSSAGGGARIGVFATDDGGRQWYLKYEFGSQPAANGYGTWVNNIDTTGCATTYTQDMYSLTKRTVVIPSATTKEPTTLFSWGASIFIKSISKAAPAIVQTDTAHGLITGDVIAIQLNSGGDTNWDWMRNDSISTTSGGNGVLFQVNVLTSVTFELHDYVHSAYNPLTCRHIHHINAQKDGWIWGTGEEYPQSWQLYMQNNYQDTYSVGLAPATYTITRINSSALSVERTMGVLMLDDSNSDLIFAMDTSIGVRPSLIFPTGRTPNITRSSNGIFTTTLANADDLTQATCIFETDNPSYCFRKINGILIFGGQKGQIAISFDNGESWDVEQLPPWGGNGNNVETLNHFGGVSGNIILISDIILALK